MTISSGQNYHIVNVKSNTALDLSGTDQTSIIGWTSHQGDNQKWRLEQREGGRWTFRNVHFGKYLAIQDQPGDGTPLVAVDQPFEWDIFPDKEDQTVYRIFLPNGPNQLNVDLSDHGNPNDGTPVTLWGKWQAGTNQTWRFEQAA